MTERLFDCRASHALDDFDLPEGITVADMLGFCKTNGVKFHALGEPGRWGKLDGKVFRVATHEYPSRGITVEFDKVRAWIAQAPERAAHEAEVVQATKDLEDAVVVLRDAYASGEPASISPRAAGLLHDIVLQYKAMVG